MSHRGATGTQFVFRSCSDRGNQPALRRHRGVWDAAVAPVSPMPFASPFFLSLLIAQLRDASSRWVAVGGLLALALVPISPPGVPILAASTVTLIGLVQRSR
jgi:hypothetical protein